jgi:hypothetical protein
MAKPHAKLVELLDRWSSESEDIRLPERVFELERYPGRVLLQQLASHLKMEAEQVQAWFY